MARNKSELRLTKLRTYYDALHRFWPDKTAGPTIAGSVGRVDWSFQSLVDETFEALPAQDQETMNNLYAGVRFAWMDKELNHGTQQK